MNRIARLLLVILLAVALLAGCADGNAVNTGTTGTSTVPGTSPATTTAPSYTLADYFPLTADVHRVYEGEGIEFAGFNSWVDYVRNGSIQLRTNNTGTEVVSVYTLGDGELKRVFFQPETYFRYDFIGQQSGDEEIFLKEPLEVGTSWALPTGETRSITGLNVAVATPYGDFEALEVTTQRKDSTEKTYYAPGVGLVKSEYSSTDGSLLVTSQLKSAETVPFTQTIRVYYPLFEENRLVYRDIPLAFNTNEDLTTRLPVLLDSIPEGSGLPAATPETPIFRGLALDAEAGTVTIDLSRDFLTWINAGSSLESQILQSITNTLGVYYGTDRVVIWLDGKPYESGHFSLGEGEAFTVNTEGIEEYKP